MVSTPATTTQSANDASGPRASLKKRMTRVPSLWQHSISGLAAGAVSTTVLYPLDLLKTRFQVHYSSPKAYPSIFHAFRTIVKEESLSGLYRGYTPAVFGASLSWGLYFFFYENAKKRYKARLFRDENSQMYSGTSQSQRKLPVFYHLISATEAGVTCVFITNPVWVIKTRLQVQSESAWREEALKAAKELNKSEVKGMSPKLYRGPTDAVMTIAKEEGIRGLYKGVVPALVLVSHGVIQFLIYEEVKHLLKTYKDGDIGAIHHFITGGASKVVASFVTSPVQVIKARLQQGGPSAAQYKGTLDCARQIWHKEGYRGFYKGMVPTIFRTAPGAALNFLVYESVAAHLGGKKKKKDVVM